MNFLELVVMEVKVWLAVVMLMPKVVESGMGMVLMMVEKVLVAFERVQMEVMLVAAVEVVE